MKKRLWVYILIVVVIFGGIFVFTKNRGTKPISVKTAVALRGDIKSYISTTATVKSKNSMQYYGLQAKIKNVNVSVGDRVKKGEVLVVYDTSDYAAAYKQAQLQYSNARLQRDDLYNQNRSITNRINDLTNQINKLQNSGNPVDMAKVETLRQQKDAVTPISTEKLEQADNAVSLAKLSLDSAKLKLMQNKSTLNATGSGVVTAVNAVAGTIGNAMQPAVEVQDIEDLKAVTALGKYDANKVALGQDVIIKSGDKVYAGKVSAIGPVATKSISATGGDASLSVEINILDRAPKLKIDFDVDVNILTGEAKNVTKVPAECLKAEKGNKNLIYVLEGNIVHERAAVVGLRSDTEAEIIKGVGPGEKVILNPSTSVGEGVLAKGE